MNIHLVRSSELSENTYLQVLDILRSVPGPLRFLGDGTALDFDDDELDSFHYNRQQFRKKSFPSDLKFQVRIREEYAFERRESPIVPDKVVSWETLFSKCEDYRELKSLGEDEYVILLTDHQNEHNWFSSFESDGLFNAFIQSSLWHEFAQGERHFPIAYQAAMLPLQQLMFRDIQRAMELVHHEPRGCMNDLCEEKKHISLKMRTADICPRCQNLIREEGISPSLVKQVRRIFENVRSSMLYFERFREISQPSMIQVRGERKDIFFTDFSDIQLKLRPIEKAVYLLFLRHPGGIALTHIQDHFKELYELYAEISNSVLIATLQNRIADLCDPASNSIHEKISRINRTITECVGEEMAGYYRIEGEHGGRKRVALERELVAMKVQDF